VICREFGRMPSDGPSALPDHVREDMKGTTYELFILLMSILSIVNLVLLAVFSWGSQNWLLILYVDTALTLIFLGDFTYRLVTATSKRRYLGRGGGVLDLLSCAPGFRIFRLFRIWRALRIIRRLGGPKMLRDLRSEIASGTVYLVVFLLTVVLEVAGLLELRFEENAPGANIKTAGDALWWGYVTATTVGYGDQYPVTTGGRLVGYLMLTCGVALFATFSGFLANTFLSKRTPRPSAPTEGDLAAALENMERLLAEQQEATDRIRAGLAELQAPKSG
jgi:voltage-gated potassium channel